MVKRFQIECISQGIFWFGFIIIFIILLILMVNYLPGSGWMIVIYIGLSLVLGWLAAKNLSKYKLEISVEDNHVRIVQTSGLLFKFREMNFNIDEIQDFFNEKGLMDYFTLKISNHRRIMIYRQLGNEEQNKVYEEMLDFFTSNTNDNYVENDVFEDRGRVSLFQTKAGAFLAVFFLLLGLFLIYVLIDMPPNDSTEFIEILLAISGCFGMVGYYFFARNRYK